MVPRNALTRLILVHLKVYVNIKLSDALSQLSALENPARGRRIVRLEPPLDIVNFSHSDMRGSMGKARRQDNDRDLNA
jgi:hypothetical protein